jgi:hypothetical protein
MESTLKALVAILIKIADMDDANKAFKYMKKIVSERKNAWSLLVLESIFRYVYGHPIDLATVLTFSDHCEKSCAVRIERKRALGQARFSSQNQPKCFQCDHLYFKHILLKIAEDREYSQIIGFKHFINQPEIVFNTSVEVIDDPAGSPFKKRLIRSPSWRDPIKMNLNLGNFIRGLISYSLREFLLNRDRRKIKVCPYCNMFFEADDIRRKTRCYSKRCEKVYQRFKKRKQRQNDPVKYF